MLSRLLINNYALIDSLSISFDDGFNVITGETGSGKSILLGALGFVIGDRSDSNVIIDDSRKCVVEAEFIFDDDRFKPFFDNYDLDYSAECVLRRELSPSKKSRAFINDTPVTVQQLKELGGQLIDIHSQHDSLLLTNPDFQLNLLDNAANNSSYLSEYSSLYRSFINTSNELKHLEELRRNSLAEADFLSFQLDELNKANLQDDEYEELTQRIELLENSEDVKNLLLQSDAILQESNDSLISQLIELKSAFDRLKRYLPVASSYLNRIESVKIELKDIARDIDGLQDDTQFDPDTLQLLRDRFDLIQRLMFKHHVNDYSELLTIRDELSTKVNSFTTIDDTIAVKSSELEQAKSHLTALAKVISERRLSAKVDFENDVTVILRQLAMPHAVFVVECVETDSLCATGKDKVRFLFSANKGVRPEEMSRVASGGELSRLMLAIKSVAAKSKYLPTLVFDEIDTGVSGEVASKLGDIMRTMGKTLQLFSITHLPQIASKADNHFFVYKDNSNAKTHSCIKQLSYQERVSEIAKMLSNDSVSTEAYRAAEVLLSCCRK
ncbi:MAG: DNA repair protein RecN [Bacteroidales bacterium]|nr:DNA repair protein RecN [Bacteroidales bacterium]MDY6075373.1 DNA repair protein RecN [Bacteroidales bacterium]